MRWIARRTPRSLTTQAALARLALKNAPHDGGLWQTLGRHLSGAGREAEAAEAFREAVALLPEDARLRLELAKSLIALDEFEDALETIEVACRLAPDEPTPRIFRFDVLMRMGRRDEADAMADEIMKVQPANPHLMRLWRWTLQSPEQLETLIERCDAVLAAVPGHTAATHAKAMALAKLQRDAEARLAMPMQPFVSITELPPPKGYADIGAFCDVLAEEMRCNPTFVLGGRGKVTENASVSVNLEQSHDAATPLLLPAFQQAVESYAARLPGDAEGFIAARPAVATLTHWGVMSGKGGRLKTHIHDGAWLSGVFYVAAPRRGGDGVYDGSLVLGAVDSHLAPREDPPWDVVEVEPVPGRLVLFPSYLPHATLPSGTDGDRICISFDVSAASLPAAA